MAIMKIKDANGNFIDIKTIQGPQGPVGPMGPKGETGSGLSIKGSYASETLFKTEHPTGVEGEAYIVEGDLFIWDNDNWNNVGAIVGPEGPEGPIGPKGEGVPTGGTTGQVLLKNGPEDYNTVWGEAPGLSADDINGLGLPTNLINGTGAGSIRNINAIDDKSHPLGQDAFAIAPLSYATGWASVALGRNCQATADFAFACGGGNLASGHSAHVEGNSNKSTGSSSHAEGAMCTASGHYSHAEGYYCTAKGEASHAEGHLTIAGSRYQHVEGEYNIEDTKNKYIHIAGNGNYNESKNAYTLDWDGNGVYAGRVSGADPVEANDFVTKQYFETNKSGTILSGTTSPTNDIGNDGDIYIQIA